MLFRSAAVTKTVGGASHFRKSTVDLRLSLQLAVGSVPAALLAVFLLSRIEDTIGIRIDTPLIVAATEPVMQGLMDHVFNNKVYPNFFKLPHRDRPVLQAHILEPGKPVTLDTSTTGSPASASTLAVPPVEISSMPSETSFVAKGTRPVLSETESSARRIGEDMRAPQCSVGAQARGECDAAFPDGFIHPCASCAAPRL